MNYRISRDLEYALMALNYMSERQEDCISAKEMTQQLKCPFHPFSRVLQKLADHKFITSKQGIRGGYVLNKSLDELSLYQLMRAVLRPLEIADCLSGHCNLLQHCNIKSPVHYLNKKFLEFYKTLSIKEILGDSSYSLTEKKLTSKTAVNL
ncbi:MAG: Rrf2 family transcriptional regulator [Oligoflexia bacterium]|nr:Rrf2 family transcriptional regulator [Oligoflexia bacterium]